MEGTRQRCWSCRRGPVSSLEAASLVLAQPHPITQTNYSLTEVQRTRLGTAGTRLLPSEGLLQAPTNSTQLKGGPVSGGHKCSGGGTLVPVTGQAGLVSGNGDHRVGLGRECPLLGAHSGGNAANVGFSGLKGASELSESKGEERRGDWVGIYSITKTQSRRCSGHQHDATGGKPHTGRCRGSLG